MVDDVLIVGGGIAGLSAAISLADRGVQVTVVERSEHALGTNIGINYRPLYALQELGILDEVAAVGQPETTDDPRFEAVFDSDGNKIRSGLPPLLGDDWTLPYSSIRLVRTELAEIMQRRAREVGVELLIGHTYRSIVPGADSVKVELSTGTTADYDLVIGADGIRSGIREQFFPDAPKPTYTGHIGVRAMFHDAPATWRSGGHLAPDGSNQRLTTAMYPGNRFYLATGKEMENRFVDQDEGRQIMRERLRPFLGTEMWDEIYERITDDLPVIVAGFEWILVPPPWHRGRILLIGDASHATAPTIGSAGGMAMEDGVILGHELEGATDLDKALTSFAKRREPRVKLVVETSAALVRSHHEHETQESERAMRHRAYSQLVKPY